jgi:PKD repeat protein
VPTKTYASPGSFTATLTVRDEYGQSSAPATLTLAPINEPAGNRAPTAVRNDPACSVLTCNFSAVGSTDPDTGDVLFYDWNWGDGTTNGTVSTLSHTFATPGTQTVTLTVRDGWGKTAVQIFSVTL